MLLQNIADTADTIQKRSKTVTLWNIAILYLNIL